MKIYRAIETPITFQDSGGSAVITLQNLAAGAARYSSQYDRGTGDLPYRYLWRGIFQFGTAPTTAGAIRLMIAEADGDGLLAPDGSITTSDSVATTIQVRNMCEFGTVGIQSAGTSVDNVASGIVEIWDRYFSIAVWNRGGGTFRNVSNTSKVIFTPIPEEIQT
jgi:hypothetical protein